MSRILFIAIPEKGHINPMIGPAVWLQKGGHAVGFHAMHDISPQLRAAGLRPAAGVAEAPPPPDLNRGEFFAEKVRDPAWLRGWIHRLLIEEAPAQIDPLEKVIRDFEADVVVTDPMIYAAAVAAHRAGVPWVAMSNSLNPVLDGGIESDLLDTVRWLSPARSALFEEHGMQVAFRGCDMLSEDLTIAFTTREFVGHDVPGVEMVGPSLPPDLRGDETGFPWERLRPPVVYASFGSQVFHQPRIFRLLIEATSTMDCQLVLSVNQLLGSERLGELPPHVLACHYAPQLELLPKVAAFVTHGGANSVMEALHFGVPLLISPVCNDQFHQSHVIDRAGVGRTLDLGSAGVEETRAALFGLMRDDAIRTSLQRVSQSYQVDGARRAAELIERLATRTAA